MKDLTKIYIDLSKLSEEQQKHISKITNYKIYDINVCPMMFLMQTEYYTTEWDQCSKDSSTIKDKTELLYPDFIKLFEGGEDNNGWIKIESEADLPKINQNVIIYDGVSVQDFYYFNNLQEFRSFYEEGGIQPVNENVTHWMPLPEPPKS